MNLKDQFLALQNKLKIESVKVDGMTDPVYVRTLTGRERDAFEASCFQQKGKDRVLNTENLRAKLLVRSICDASGERLFTDADVVVLGNMPSDVLDTLFAKAQELSGLGAKDVEEMVGN